MEVVGVADTRALDVRKEETSCIFDVIVLEDRDGEICTVVDLKVECTSKDVIVVVTLGNRDRGVVTVVVGFASTLESREGFSVGRL